MQMNSALGKRILAMAREGDYAHAGEEEAIRLALQTVPKNPNQRLLDAGCGRGGTACFVQANGWGHVTGFDIEGQSVKEAQALHPEIKFAVCDVLAVADHVRPPFDIIYAFNAFYTFPDQAGALRALRAVAGPEARLVLFDYVDRGGFVTSDFARTEEATHWRPLDLTALPGQLAAAGWALDAVRDLDPDYERWYVALLQRFEAKRDAITELAGDALYRHAWQVYRLLLDAIQQGHLGGAIVEARAVAV